MAEKNPLQQLPDLGQAPWCDEISRKMIDDGTLVRFIEEWGLTGVTSNPTIFQKAITEGDYYDSEIQRLAQDSSDPHQIFEQLALEDIRRTADTFQPIYERTNGEKGFVSIEVNPHLAYDTDKTIGEAVRLFEALNRPNVFIKVPGTSAGVPAIRYLLAEGVNVNITLLFSVEDYTAVVKAYLEALAERLEKGKGIDSIRSVASFFVSRVDSKFDDALSKIASSHPDRAQQAKDLRGKFGIANSRHAYQEFKRFFQSEEFTWLRKDGGASAQRVLWASTSVKDPHYRDTMYIEELIGEDTVNTMPIKTLEAFADHGTVSRTVENYSGEAQELRREFTNLGIEVDKLISELQSEGVEKFSKSYDELIGTVENQLSSG